MMRVCQRQRRHLCESLRERLLVPPFTRALLKSPSSRGLSAIVELLISTDFADGSKVSAQWTPSRSHFHSSIVKNQLTVIRQKDSFYRAISYSSGIICRIILPLRSFVRPSVRLSHACFMTKPNSACLLYTSDAADE